MIYKLYVEILLVEFKHKTSKRKAPETPKRIVSNTYLIESLGGYINHMRKIKLHFPYVQPANQILLAMVYEAITLLLEEHAIVQYNGTPFNGKTYKYSPRSYAYFSFTDADDIMQFSTPPITSASMSPSTTCEMGTFDWLVSPPDVIRSNLYKKLLSDKILSLIDFVKIDESGSFGNIESYSSIYNEDIGIAGGLCALSYFELYQFVTYPNNVLVSF